MQNVHLLLLLLVSAAVHSSAARTVGGDEAVRRERRGDDLSLGALQTLVQQQASVIGQLQAELGAQKNLVASMNTQLQAVQRKVDVASQSVAFTARISRKYDSVTNGMSLGHFQTVVFDEVVTNIGNAYDAKSGIFTAPVAGTYLFALHQMSANGQRSVYLAIVKNGAVLDMVYSEGHTDNFDQGSSQVSTHLAAGERVWVRQNEGTAIRGGWWTIFTGVLVHAG